MRRGVSAVQSGDFGPRIECDNRLAEFFREANLGERAAFAGESDYGVGTGDDDGVASLADAGCDREFDVPVCGAPIVAGQDADRMSTLLARARRCGFHDAGASAIDQHRAAPCNLASELEGELADGTR